MVCRVSFGDLCVAFLGGLVPNNVATSPDKLASLLGIFDDDSDYRFSCLVDLRVLHSMTFLVCPGLVLPVITGGPKERWCCGEPLFSKCPERLSNSSIF